jgi:NAD(P)-dependent dehydrogenase (short-subunit alcohol dehydrogenase family)
MHVTGTGMRINLTATLRTSTSPWASPPERAPFPVHMPQTVFITGASSGIGRHTAQLFHAVGWNVVATMRTPANAADWARDGDRMLVTPLDVTRIESIEAARDAAVARFGTIQVVVNNAGYGLVGPFEASTHAQIQRQIDTNVFGVMHVTRALLPHLREQRAGTIINVASVGGRITFPLYSLYHATKWAVEGFSESLQHELRPFGVRVKIIEPGPIKTDFYDRSIDIMSTPGLTAYDHYVARVMPNLNRAGATAPDGSLVAKVILRAATDNSNKLRYSANAAPLLALRKVLPDSLFNALIRMVVKG